LPGRSTAPRPWGILGAVWCQVRRGIWPRRAVALFGPRKILVAWLNGATVNTDRDLRPQYLAGLSLNIRDQHGIHAELTAARRFPDGLFVGSAANLAELRSAIENAEPGFLHRQPEPGARTLNPRGGMDIEAAPPARAERTERETRREPALLTPCIYLVAFVSGAIVMSFEMLGSRYLAPYFGSGIYTWAALISTVLAALCAGYFFGGALADRRPSPVLLAATLAIGSAYLVLLPAFAEQALEFFVWSIDDIALGGLAAAFAIMFFPVMMLGIFSPFAIRLLLHSQLRSGTVSGMVYGISTGGSIVGTLGTTFFLIPSIGSRAITYAIGVLGIIASLLLIAAARGRPRASVGMLSLLLIIAALPLRASALAGAQPIIASTTSTILADDLAGAVAHPERFLNAHWLNPAYLVPLVELSPAATTAPATVARFKALLEAIGKVPVVCAARPGYIVPRIQALAMNEAARMVEEGVASAEEIDKAIRFGFGFRYAILGLLEFIDWGGGDILYYASRYLEGALGSDRYRAPEVISHNMREGRIGLRTGAGFLDYSGLDIEAYREQRLKAMVDMLHHFGLARPPVLDQN